MTNKLALTELIDNHQITFTRSTAAVRGILSSIFLLFIDLASVALSAMIAIQLRMFVLPLVSATFFAGKLLEETLILLWWYPLAFLFSIAYEKLYHKRLPFWVEVESLIKACTLALFIGFAFIYLTGNATAISRAVVIATWLLALFLVPIGRYFGKKILLKLHLWICPVILIGTAEAAFHTARAFERENTMGYLLLGYIDPGSSTNLSSDGNTQKKSLPCLGSLLDGEEIIANSPALDLMIAMPGAPSEELVELANRFQPQVNNIMIVPDLFGITLNGIEVTYFFEEQVLYLQIKNRLKSGYNRLFKRCFDLAVASLLTLLITPAFLIMAALVRLSSPGPIFYTQERIGQRGRIFKAYKFRTMYIDGDEILHQHLASNVEAQLEWNKYKKLKNDPRVTGFGRFLRRFSLDELPQLFNILFNHMSLVGPRPYLPRENKDMGSWARDILITKPGLTGLWQVSGRNNLSFKSRLRLDSWYVRNWSLWLDITLILRTIRVVARAEGAY